MGQITSMDPNSMNKMSASSNNPGQPKFVLCVDLSLPELAHLQ